MIQKAGIAGEQIQATVSTGYGRDRVDDRLAAVTEISCHARGIKSVLISHGKEVKEIVAGMNRAIAYRISALVKRVSRDTTGLSIAMSGGVAHNRGVVRALRSAFGQDCGSISCRLFSSWSKYFE
ncbi:hypothetical protein ACFL2E_10945 [Thermodesulfobacteriota bacterium]